MQNYNLRHITPSLTWAYVVQLYAFIILIVESSNTELKMNMLWLWIGISYQFFWKSYSFFTFSSGKVLLPSSRIFYGSEMIYSLGCHSWYYLVVFIWLNKECLTNDKVFTYVMYSFICWFLVCIYSKLVLVKRLNIWND